MIIFKDWKLRYIGDLLARQNDNLSRLLLVEGVPDGYDWVMKVQVQLNGRRDAIPLRKMDGGVGAVLTENQLAYAGYYSLQLMGTLSSDGVTTRHTNQLRVYIGPSLAGGGDWPEVPSEYTQFEDRLRELNQHPPVPGPNGYWMIWNTEADKYEESDFVLPSGEDDDPVTPESIGAIPSSDKGKAGGVATLDSGGKVPSGQIPSLEYAGKTHANQHASGGSDPITPESIGAASKNLVESDLLVPKDTEDPASYLDNLLDEYIATKPNGSVGYIKIQLSTLHPTLSGGQYIASVSVITQSYVSIEAISYASGTSNNIVRKYTRSKCNDVWGEWTAASTASSGESSGTPSAHASTHATGGSDPITPESIGAAPAGYGLGSAYGGYIDDFNTKVKTGWYIAAASSLNPPVDPAGNVNLAYGVLRVEQREGLICQYYSDQRYSAVIKLQRISTDKGSTWGEWEFINPQMKTGIEYRTTERHLGNPVYKKMDSDGVIWWSTDQSTWKREAERVGAAPVLKAGKTIYISTTGNDETGDGSESSPYATIQKAIDSLPKNLGGNTVTINVASGTYNAVSGSPIISATKFYNGMLDIRGPSSSDKAVLNGNISITKCDAIARVIFLKAVGTDLWNGMQFQNGCIYIYDCQDVLINNCDIDGVDKSESGILVGGQSNVGISNGDISNCDKAITTRSANSTRGLATVSIYQMAGANNNVFIHSEAAVVSDYYNNTVEAATKYSRLGGVIIKPDGTVEGNAEKPKLLSVSLKASGWNSSAKTQTVTVSGVLADETKQLITPTPAIASQETYYNAGIRCTGQSANKLTFTAKTIPTADLTVYVTIQEVGA